MTVLINAVAFYLCWLACVLGAAQGHPWVGPLCVAVFLFAQWRFGGLAPAHRQLVIVAMVFGFLLDSALSALGWYRFVTQPPDVAWAPAWMVALWANFALALPVSLSWLRGRWLASVLLGGIGGPLSYLAGERLGAIALADGALLVLAGVWALVTPGLVVLTHRRSGSAG